VLLLCFLKCNQNNLSFLPCVAEGTVPLIEEFQSFYQKEIEDKGRVRITQIARKET